MRSDLAKNFNRSFNNFASLLMFFSFIGMSFLLISASISILGQFAKADAINSPWFILFEVLMFGIEIALAAVYVDIHRRGVSAAVGFKNFWHFITIIFVIVMTFQIEKTSIAYGLSFIQQNIIKKDVNNYVNNDLYKNALRNKQKAEKELKKWESWNGDKADILLKVELEQQYRDAKAEKAFRLRNYKHATTKKADAKIADAIKQLKELEEGIAKKKAEHLAMYSKIERLAVERMHTLETTHKDNQKKEILSFSKQAEEWAHKVVFFMGLIYLIHGALLVVSEDDFKMRDWLVRLLPILEDKIQKVESEAKAILEEPSENVIKFEPKKADVPKRRATDLSHAEKYEMLKKVVKELLEEQLVKGGSNMPGFRVQGRDPIFKMYKKMQDENKIGQGLPREFITNFGGAVFEELIPVYRQKLNELKRVVG